MIVKQLVFMLTISLGSYCHIAGSLLVFVDDLEIHHGASELKVWSAGIYLSYSPQY